MAVADKYGVPTLAAEALKGLTTYITSIDEAALLLASLKILTDEFSDYNSLEQLVTKAAKPHLDVLSHLSDFASWIARRPTLLQGLVQDATTLKNLKTVRKFRCSFCGNVLIGMIRPKCCKNMPASIGHALLTDDEYESDFGPKT